MITDTELYYYRWDELVDKELRRAVELACEYYGDENAANVLRCTRQKLNKLRSPNAKVADLFGEAIIELSLDDVIVKRTLDSLRLLVAGAIIRTAQPLGSARDLVRFLDISARGIGRIMGNVNRSPALQHRDTRLPPTIE